MRHTTFSLVLAALLSLLCFHSPHAAPRTMPGVCGSTLPKYSRLIGKNRYHVTYHRTLYGVLKMYRKVYGSKNPRYKMTRILSLSHVVVYHFKSYNPNTRWAGLNIVHYKQRRRAIQIYVICRK